MKTLITIMLVLFLSPVAAQSSGGYEKSGGYERSGGYEKSLGHKKSFGYEKFGFKNRRKEPAAASHRDSRRGLYAKQLLKRQESQSSWLKERIGQNEVLRSRKPMPFMLNEQRGMGGQYRLIYQ